MIPLGSWRTLNYKWDSSVGTSIGTIIQLPLANTTKLHNFSLMTETASQFRARSCGMMASIHIKLITTFNKIFETHVYVIDSRDFPVSITFTISMRFAIARALVYRYTVLNSIYSLCSPSMAEKWKNGYSRDGTFCPTE